MHNKPVSQASTTANAPLDETGLIGEAIRQARLKSGLTQAELGERIGVQKAQISRLENGKRITLHSMLKVFTALGIPTTLELSGVGRFPLVK